MLNKVFVEGTIKFASNVRGRALQNRFIENDWELEPEEHGTGNYAVRLAEGLETQYDNVIDSLKGSDVEALSFKCCDDHKDWRIDLIEGMIVRRERVTVFLVANDIATLHAWLDDAAEGKKVLVELPGTILDRANRRGDVVR